MVEHNEPRLDAVYHALADATRRRMLRALAAGELSVGQLAEPHAMSLAAASKHVKVLEQAGLVTREVQGRTHRCRLAPGPLAEAHDWLRHYEAFWTHHLGLLDGLLRADAARDAGHPATKGKKP